MGASTDETKRRGGSQGGNVAHMGRARDLFPRDRHKALAGQPIPPISIEPFRDFPKRPARSRAATAQKIAFGPKKKEPGPTLNLFGKEDCLGTPKTWQGDVAVATGGGEG